jgi:hypothetical protein
MIPRPFHLKITFKKIKLKIFRPRWIDIAGNIFPTCIHRFQMEGFNDNFIIKLASKCFAYSLPCLPALDDFLACQVLFEKLVNSKTR